jgi:hypothetical protein
MQSEEAVLKPICDGFLRKPISRFDLASQMRNFCRIKPDAEKKAVPAGTEESVPADADNAARLPELLPHMERCHVTWEGLLNAPLVSEVERFARHLETLGDEYYMPQLRDYGKRLAASAARFDLIGMENTLQDFGTLFAQLKSEAEAQT